MTRKSKTMGFLADENTRRYYLDLMGVQTWLPYQDDENIAQKTNKSSVTNNTLPAQNQLPNWQQLKDKITQCKKCSLHKNCQQKIIGQGNQQAKVMLVLFAPDNNAPKNQLCVTVADELLHKMLGAINISKQDVYLSSLIKCQTSTKPTTATIEHCQHYLQQQLNLIKPQQVLVLGEDAIQACLQNTQTIDQARALINQTTNPQQTLQKYFNGAQVLVSYSPNELLLQTDNKRKSWEDLKQLQKIMASKT